MDALGYTLTLTSGVSWTIVYLAIINRSFKDKTCGMPFFALALNLAWEFIFSFVLGGGLSLQVIINVTWFFFDVVILYAYLRYGRQEFPTTVDQKWFIPWTWLAIAVGVVTQYFAALEFPGLFGPTYPAFVINLVMSILFIGMLVRRDGVEGQSMGIAIFKWLGTAAPTILFYVNTGSNLVLVLGICVFLFDLIYAVMLYQKSRMVGVHPFTRAPAH
ncbi:MAG: hypothetical protein JXA14_19325 [Anaerolineae bacterium]|nr:hypothetical protein [Anaerolineae bacterium]